MRQESVSPVGVVLIVCNWILASAILLEYAAVQDLLRGVDANWQDQYDSGTMAFASIPVLFGLFPPALATFAALSGLAIRRLRSTAVGWTSLVAHVALLVSILNGPGAPGSAMGFWVRLAGLTAYVGTGIVAGANLRTLDLRRPPSVQVDAVHSTPEVSRKHG